MDALKLLKQDHDEVKQLLSQLEDSSDATERQDLFDKIKRELTMHEIIEEELVYPAFEKQAKLKEIVLESYEEHHVVDLIMQEIEDVSPEEDSWEAKAKVMKENVEHHIEEEEGEMFKTARDLFDSRELDELGKQMQARKAELQEQSPEELEDTRDAA